MNPSSTAISLSTTKESSSEPTSSIFLALAFLGVLCRLFFVVSGGSEVIGRLSGGGDAPAYVLLGDSLYHGKGLSYVGKPSAFRPPLYPILLAGTHLVFGKYYLLFVRLLQFAAGILAAYVCALTAAKLWGPSAKYRCFALVLVSPTLMYLTGEILTETFASLVAAIFLYLLVRSDGSIKNDVAMGTLCGIAAVLRFNMVFLPVIAAWHIFRSTGETRRRNRVLIVFGITAIILLPWIVRNLFVFDGRVLYSTHTGMDLVEGLIEPAGRAGAAQQQQIIRETGWVMQGLERGDSRRLFYGSEPELNKQALHAAIRLWSNSPSTDLRVIFEKLGYFWLSTDQFSQLRNFSAPVRFFRISGVIIHWILLVVAFIGLRKLFASKRSLAWTLIFYALTATGLHLLFAMNTRLRVPLLDPMLYVLAMFWAEEQPPKGYAKAQPESATGAEASERRDGPRR